MTVLTGYRFVAEGVENTEQVEFLKQLQCTYAQGFLFSRPVDAEAAQKLLLAPGYTLQGNLIRPKLACAQHQARFEGIELMHP